MTADYDPLALPAAYFEGLPTGVPNNLPSQPEPVTGTTATPPAVCDSCGAPASEEMNSIARRLLGSLDPARHDQLATLYGGTAPEVLCPACLLPTIGTLNRTAVSGSR